MQHCWPAPGGTLAASAMICAAMSSSTWASTTPGTGCAGHAGAGVTSTNPAPTTTSGKRPSTRAH